MDLKYGSTFYFVRSHCYFCTDFVFRTNVLNCRTIIVDLSYFSFCDFVHFIFFPYIILFYFVHFILKNSTFVYPSALYMMAGSLYIYLFMSYARHDIRNVRHDIMNASYLIDVQFLKVNKESKQKTPFIFDNVH